MSILRRRLALTRRLVLLSGAALLVAISVAAPTAVPTPAHAASTDFQAGRIISDGQFYDGNAMKAPDIQAFLNGKVARCTIGDAGRHAGMQWGTTTIANQCLRDYRANTASRAANAYCAAYSGAAGETAAEIIAKVSQACGISPKVLLVMLEKEQSLITDSWPTNRQLDYAMGYACPDSGPNNSANCDTSQSGFYQQVYRAAWQLKVYRANPSNYRYQPFQSNEIQWHPNIGCGTSQVYIENWATAALYIYTPYRPNQAALNAGWGTGDSCSSYGNRNFFNYYSSWFGSPIGASNPFGAIDIASGIEGGVRVSGWAIDPDNSDPIDVHVYIGNQGYSIAANSNRPDVAAAYPAFGGIHGFDTVLESTLVGLQNVCFYGINRGAGVNTLLGCKVVTVLPERPVSDKSRAPLGALDSVELEGERIRVAGWAIDRDTEVPIAVHIYQDGVGIATLASTPRPDVARHYPHHGANHGFSVAVESSSGLHEICAYAIDHSGKAVNTLLGCKSVTVASGSPIQELSRSPIGAFDAVTATSAKITIRGWAIDPDTAAPIAVHAYVGGAGVAFEASSPRPDVARHYSAYGDNHGFIGEISGYSGRQNVCVYAIDTTGNANHSLLGCKIIDVPAGTPGTLLDENRSPFGALDIVSVSSGAVTLKGWAIDPDTSATIAVHAYVGSDGFALQASENRTDVGNAYPAYGPMRGFDASLAARSGSQNVCAYAIDHSGKANNTLLGCRTVVVP